MLADSGALFYSFHCRHKHSRGETEAASHQIYTCTSPQDGDGQDDNDDADIPLERQGPGGSSFIFRDGDTGSAGLALSAIVRRRPTVMDCQDRSEWFSSIFRDDGRCRPSE